MAFKQIAFNGLGTVGVPFPWGGETTFPDLTQQVLLF